MMYYLRGLLVSVSVFVLVYLGWSALVCCGWRKVQGWIRQFSPATAANLLYALRVSPAVLALVVVLGLSLPSFLRYEPHGSGEALGVAPVALTVVFAVFGFTGSCRAWRACSRTQRMIRDWTSCARRVESQGLAYFVSGTNAPPIALAGISRPALVVSADASRVLSPPELSCSVEHELAHLRAHDNLKKLVLHACAFPFMGELERAWLDAVEYSADFAAVHSEGEALDLASALVKISRLADGRTLPELASGFAEGPASLLERRIQRLIAWHPEPVRRALGGSVAAAAAIAGAPVLAISYPNMLRAAHLLTEFLVR